MIFSPMEMTGIRECATVLWNNTGLQLWVTNRYTTQTKKVGQRHTMPSLIISIGERSLAVCREKIPLMLPCMFLFVPECACGHCLLTLQHSLVVMSCYPLHPSTDADTLPRGWFDSSLVAEASTTLLSMFPRSFGEHCWIMLDYSLSNMPSVGIETDFNISKFSNVSFLFVTYYYCNLWAEVQKLVAFRHVVCGVLLPIFAPANHSVTNKLTN